MKCIGLNHRPTFINDYLKPAIQAGFVEMTQPDSPKSPTQKYRLTTKGNALLATQQQGVSSDHVNVTKGRHERGTMLCSGG